MLRRVSQPQPAFRFSKVGSDGFEPPKVKTSRFTVCPIWPLWYSPKILSRTFEPMEGIEPTTPRLQITCSGQLSYIGIQPLRDAKVGIFFIIANFSEVFFQNSYFLLSTTLLSTFKELPTPDLYYFVGKSSANIITLSLIKKQLNVFFAKKLKKYHFAIHLYLYIIDFWWLRP